MTDFSHGIPPFIDRDVFRNFLKDKPLLTVQTAPVGRFILPVPNLDDGKGPLLTPNIKELDAKLRGSSGELKIIELEAGPQKIPADGTNVIVINRVDEFAQLALNAKLNSLIERENGKITRAVIENFMSYARGYSYDTENETVHFFNNAGFRNDVYNMTVQELKERYVDYADPAASLEDKADADIKAGYYIKKLLDGNAAFIKGNFETKVGQDAGGTIQGFNEGALIHIPVNHNLPVSFVHLTDIETCYTRRDGAPIVDAETGTLPGLPVYDIDEVMAARIVARPAPHFQP